MSRVFRFVWLGAMLVALIVSADWARVSFPMSAQAAAQPQIYKVGDDGTSAPRLLTRVDPAYSEEARKQSIEGTVKLACEVHADGRAHNLRVLEGLGGGLNDQAIAAVEAWTFQPAKKDGKPVAVSATIEVNFRLLDKAPQ